MAGERDAQLLARLEIQVAHLERWQGEAMSTFDELKAIPHEMKAMNTKLAALDSRPKGWAENIKLVLEVVLFAASAMVLVRVGLPSTAQAPVTPTVTTIGGTPDEMQRILEDAANRAALAAVRQYAASGLITSSTAMSSPSPGTQPSGPHHQ
jgi:hypothetical protein